jgi:uncharacterized RDD family membrane protein YckC
MPDIPQLPSPEPRPRAGGYGGLWGYEKGNFGAPPPTGGMPYRKSPDAPKRAADRRPRERDPGGRGEQTVRLVGAPVWRRAVAATIDTIVVFGPIVGVYLFLDSVLYKGSCDKVTGFYGESQLINCSSSAKLATFGLTILVGFVLAFVVEVGPTAGGRQSLGRHLAGARAVDGVTASSMGLVRAAGRFAFRSFISILAGIGFLWMIWDRDDRTLHDIVCRSTVVDGPRWRVPRRRRRRTGFLAP